ncbi:YIP1 family protein [Candidatus Saganbacteria bacterium]|nr:YIP1 family protein [Candidatus Saganbacteria bacterium]
MAGMWIFDRAREILLFPKEAWEKIKLEEIKDWKTIIIYPVVLALFSAAAFFIGYFIVGVRIGVVGYYRMSAIDAFFSAVVFFFLALLGVVVTGFIILFLASYFLAEGDFFAALKLSVYSATAPILASAFNIIPGLKILEILGLYGAYLLYAGIPLLMKAPHDKEQQFIFTSIIFAVVMVLLIHALVGSYVSPIFREMIVY